MAVKTLQRKSARERLLAAADQLFYAEGVHVVGVDRIAERAGVTKATLYNTFGSKEDLVRAYLEQQLRRAWTRIAAVRPPPRARPPRRCSRPPSQRGATLGGRANPPKVSQASGRR